ncbi:MAG TPA: acetylornithine deacetylase [Aliidongia sp.]|uniref:acetylornithine deacetylase n=1 Tax=Aliidongia sp. TaxID=1914230 RepID=UPI002DDD57E6|nr:acetylornithine deacetylase [Aliidongia sp.]HEV2673416.1 acetylornithine deacetylase [Aliidongia sp.]
MAAPTSIEMITKLVGFDTTSRDSNLALIDWVEGYLADLGIKSDRSWDADRRKANLFATIGPEDKPGIVLSGHTDVVPVDGQDWTSDPFELVQKDGKLYGRGASDMKGFLGVVLAKTPEFVRRQPKTPLHLAFTYDEEVGCLGVRTLLADLARRPVRPRACVVGEPTLMKPVIGHKGKQSVRCHVHGLECHSALAHQGVNAVEAAAELVAYLKGMARRFRDQGPFDPDYSPPYTTVHTGKIQGGTALNIVPKDCSFDFEFRYLPSEDPAMLFGEVQRFAAEKLLPEMRAISAAAGFDFQELSGMAGLDMSSEDEVTRLVMQLSGANGTGKVSFGTEGGLYQEFGIPTIVCGPGSIEQAHKPDEWIEIEQLVAAERFMDRLLDHAAQG